MATVKPLGSVIHASPTKRKFSATGIQNHQVVGWVSPISAPWRSSPKSVAWTTTTAAAKKMPLGVVREIAAISASPRKTSPR